MLLNNKKFWPWPIVYLWKSGEGMRMLIVNSQAFTTKSEIWAHVIARCHRRYYLIICFANVDANADMNVNVDADSDAIILIIIIIICRNRHSF